MNAVKNHALRGDPSVYPLLQQHREQLFQEPMKTDVVRATVKQALEEQRDAYDAADSDGDSDEPDMS